MDDVPQLIVYELKYISEININIHLGKQISVANISQSQINVWSILLSIALIRKYYKIIILSFVITRVRYNYFEK